MICTTIASGSGHLNKKVELFQFWAMSYLNSQNKYEKVIKIEFGNISAFGSILGRPFLTRILNKISLQKLIICVISTDIRNKL